MLPDLDGFEVAQRLRDRAGPHVPVLFLTARDSVEDRISGPDRRRRRLRHQAVQPGGGRAAHPGDPAAQPRRAEREPTPACCATPTWSWTRTRTRCAAAAGWSTCRRPSSTCCATCWSTPGRVVSKAQILDRVWSYDFGGDGRIVESYVYYLRKKIDCWDPPLIHTVRGVGYALRLPRGGETNETTAAAWRHWTLRSRLVVVVAALAAVALIVANVAGVLLLRTLPDRPDRRAAQPAMAPRSPPRRGPPAPRPVRRPSRAGAFDAYRRSRLRRRHGAPSAVQPAADEHIAADRRSVRRAARSGAEQASRSPSTPPTARADWRRGRRSRDAAAAAWPSPAISLRAGRQHRRPAARHRRRRDASVLVLLGLGLAASVVRLGLRPLTRMERAAAEIAAGDLSGRVADTDPHTEPGRLGLALNTMLDRIEARGRRADRVRAAAAAVPRGRLARAAHPAHLDPRLRRAVPARRRPARPRSWTRRWPGSRTRPRRMGLLVEDLLLLARLDEERAAAAAPGRPARRSPPTPIRDAHVRVPDRPVRLAGFATTPATSSRSPCSATSTGCARSPPTWSPTRCSTPRRRPGSPCGSGGWPGVPAAAPHGRGPDRRRRCGACRRSPCSRWPTTGRACRPRTPRGSSSGSTGPTPAAPARHGGSGLGLSIVAAIVQRPRRPGRAGPAPGGGAAFRVLLPRPVHEPASPRWRTSVAPSAPATGCRPCADSRSRGWRKRPSGCGNASPRGGQRRARRRPRRRGLWAYTIVHRAGRRRGRGTGGSRTVAGRSRARSPRRSPPTGTVQSARDGHAPASSPAARSPRST